jgi:hypothetical protein
MINVEAKNMTTSISLDVAGTMLDEDDEGAMLPTVHRPQLGIFPPEIDFRFPLRKPIRRA